MGAVYHVASPRLSTPFVLNCVDNVLLKIASVSIQRCRFMSGKHVPSWSYISDSQLVEVWAVRQPQIKRNRVWRLPTQHSIIFTSAMFLADNLIESL